MSSQLEVQLIVYDDEITDRAEFQAVLTTLVTELDQLQADLAVLPVATAESQAGMLAKGESSSSILDIKINLDVLKSFGGWLYGRLVGTSTKVKFEYGELKFEFEGRTDRDRAAAMQDFERFITNLEAEKAKREAAKPANHG